MVSDFHRPLTPAIPEESQGRYRPLGFGIHAYSLKHCASAVSNRFCARRPLYHSSRADPFMLKRGASPVAVLTTSIAAVLHAIVAVKIHQHEKIKPNLLLLISNIYVPVKVQSKSVQPFQRLAIP